MTRTCIILLAFLLLGCGTARAEGGRPGFENCLTCHAEIKRLVGAKAGHSPFREFRCGSCHTPHASREKGLLKDEVADLCRDCHRDLKADMGPDRTHRPFAEGRCLSCHSPHAAENPKLLVKRGGDLCFGCHSKDQGGFAASTQHRPAREGRCLSCHRPHGSEHDALAAKDRAELCVSCHPASGAGAAKGHQGMSVAGSDCMSCHSPHGSDRDGLVKKNLHPPFAKKSCSGCHQGGGREGARSRGAEACLSCHQAVAQEFKAVNSHVGGGAYCVSCHSPHASDQEHQMRAGQQRVCRGCHQDAGRDGQDAGKTVRHPLVAKGQCSGCHEPHGSNSRHMLASDEIRACTGCHKRHAAFTHPVGERAQDPRSKRDVTCITCHDPMGAGNEYALRFDRRKTLCVQCHKGY
ncbi:MAG: cytochrome c3 family protein [Thermodesulfobacteriota bacterium]